MGPDGFSWSGSLDETDIQSLYAACQSLRFSGKLELRDGATKAEVTFVGGEPIEIDGGDTQRIALWNRGTFRAVQSIPNLSGELTGQREMEGSLAITKASQLWAWVSEYRLTCDIDLERPGSKAIVSFSNGHAESAQVNGAPELAALARVSSWTDGTFRVRLKPLFIEGVIAAPPPMPESAPPAGRQFDVSRSIPMDIKLREQQKLQTGNASFGPAKRVGGPTPPLGELAMGPSSTARPGEERTSETQPLPPPSFARQAAQGTSQGINRNGGKRNPFDPMELSKPYPRHEGAMTPRGRKMPWLLSLTAIVLAAGLGALYYFHLPPFSPPPKPVEATPSGEAASGEAVKPSGEAASGEAVKPSGVAASGQAVKPSGVAATGEATKPTGIAVKPSGEAVKPKNETPKEKPTDKIVAKGRLLLIEGHSHTALEQFRRAIKMAPPKDVAVLKQYELQAQGKLGKAELMLEGKGSVTVDGHKFAVPKKLRVMAGPHVIDAGDGDEEVALKRGEKRRVKAKK